MVWPHIHCVRLFGRVPVLKLAVLLVLTSHTVHAQEINWLQRDNTDNSSTLAGRSYTEGMGLDADGNVYALIHFTGEISIGNGNNEQLLTSEDNQFAFAVVKYSPDGQLLWHRLYTFLNADVLSGQRVTFNVSPEGRVLFVSRLIGGSEITFDGDTFAPGTSGSHLFYVSLNADGDLLDWKFQQGVYQDFDLERFDGSYIYDDGRYWLSGVYEKNELEENGTIHTVYFVNFYDARGNVIEEHVYDPGARREGESVGFLNWWPFEEVAGELYLKASGNRFFGYNDARPTDGLTYRFMFKLNTNGGMNLVFATTDPNDRVVDFMLHEDGSYTFIGEVEDGILNTTIGDIAVTPGDVMVHIKVGEVIRTLARPGWLGGLVPVANRDDLIGMVSRTIPGSSVPDGHGNTLTIPGPETNFTLAMYNKDLKLEYIDFFEIGEFGHVGINNVEMGEPCGNIHLGGGTRRLVNFNLGEGQDRFTSDEVSFVYFVTQYGNEPPQMELPSAWGFCPEEEKTLEVLLDDEYLSGVTVSAFSPNGDFDPTRVNISGQGIKRNINLDSLGFMGDLTVGIRIEDACGEFKEQQVTVSVAPLPPAPVLSQTGDILLCEGDTLKLTATATQPLLWSDGSMGDTLKITRGGSYSAQQMVGVNCISPSSDTLNVVLAVSPHMPEIEVAGSLVLCPGAEVTLTASLNERLVWSTGDTVQSITVSEPGIYSVYQTSEHCGDSEANRVEVRMADLETQPVIEAVGGNQVCEGGQVVLRSSAGANSLWSTGDTGEEIRVSTSGIYRVRRFEGDCEGPDSEPMEVVVNESFTVTLANDTTVCGFVGPVELVPEVSRPGLDFLWSDGSTGSSLIVTEPGEYWVEVSNGACMEMARARVEERCLPLVFLPNAFSPNGDGENDRFGPVGQRVFDFKMIIYNQWGRMVFVSHDINQGWDGTLEGKEVQAGTYIYQISYNGYVNGELVSYTQNGKVDLIR